MAMRDSMGEAPSRGNAVANAARQPENRCGSESRQSYSLTEKVAIVESVISMQGKLKLTVVEALHRLGHRDLHKSTLSKWMKDIDNLRQGIKDKRGHKYQKRVPAERPGVALRRQTNKVSNPERKPTVVLALSLKRNSRPDNAPADPLHDRFNPQQTWSVDKVDKQVPQQADDRDEDTISASYGKKTPSSPAPASCFSSRKPLPGDDARSHVVKHVGITEKLTDRGLRFHRNASPTGGSRRENEGGDFILNVAVPGEGKDTGELDLDDLGIGSPGAMDISAVDEAWARGRWLLALLVLQSTSSMVLDSYQDLLRDHLVVTLFLTMLVGAGGNAGNQSAIKVIRGLATGHLKANGQSFRKILRQQAAVGAMLGVSLAAGGWLRVYITSGDMLDATAISISLVCIVFSSVVLGASLPFGLAKLGLDPANAGTTIQVLMDILGVLTTCVTCHFVLDQLALRLA